MKQWLPLVASCALVAGASAVSPANSAVADEAASVSGTLTGNGETIELPYVYVYAEKGFYEKSDPAWRVVFAAEPLEERDVDEFFLDFPYVKVAITITAEFGDEPQLEVYGQDVKLSAEGGNISGGTYPEIEMESTGPDRFAGRVYLPEMHEFFDDSYQYDFTFSAPLSDPNAPIGEPLPADGGEPGRAYLAWVEAIRALDVERLRTMVTPEMAEMLDSEDAMENLEFMRDMTADDVRILGGSSDGTTAILQVEGTMEGEAVSGEITLTQEGGFWLPVNESWE